MKSNIRDFSKIMPDHGICALCNLREEECKCVKYCCKCKILSLNCSWPTCVCTECLEVIEKCLCKIV
jgi:hypothetical protein